MKTIRQIKKEIENWSCYEAYNEGRKEFHPRNPDKLDISKELLKQLKDVLKIVESNVPTTWLHPVLKDLVIKEKYTTKDIEDLLRGIKRNLIFAISGGSE